MLGGRLNRPGPVRAHAQEFNSVEAIKSAVQYGLGAALVSSAAIAKEMDLGLFRKLDIAGVRLTRTLSLVRCPRTLQSFFHIWGTRCAPSAFSNEPGKQASGARGLSVVASVWSCACRPCS